MDCFAPRPRIELIVRPLDKTLAKPPLMLAEENTAEVGEFWRAILRRPKDPLAVFDRDGNDRGMRNQLLTAKVPSRRVVGHLLGEFRLHQMPNHNVLSAVDPTRLRRHFDDADDSPVVSAWHQTAGLQVVVAAKDERLLLDLRRGLHGVDVLRHLRLLRPDDWILA